MSKKGQEEMMGFVLIVLVVIVIGLVFFAFALRKPKGTLLEQKSAEMDDMLYAMLQCETNCTDEHEPLKDAIRSCAEGGCCDVVNDTISKMLTQFLGEDIAGKPIHGYKLEVLQNNNVVNQLNFSAGNFSGNFFAASSSIPVVGASPIEVELTCWYG